jgi:outer membrane receptor protein involved in Fe transport
MHLGEDLSIVMGAHQIGIGASLVHQNFNGSSGVARVPNPVFNGHFTNMGLADFMLGKASSFVQGNATLSNTRQNSIGMYIQDTWKATSRLTLSLGLRWEPHTAPYALGRPMHFEREWFDKGIRSTVFKNAPAGLQYTGDPLSTGLKLDYDSWLKFAPRFGLAWDAQGNGKPRCEPHMVCSTTRRPCSIGARTARPGVIR